MPEPRRLPRAGLDALLQALRDRGYTLIGPQLGDGAIVFDEIEGADDLPVGWTEHQAPGHYRLAQREDDAVFGYTVGPHSPKRFLFPSQRTVFRARHEPGGLRFVEEPVDETPRALIAVRSCELAAMAIQDRVFMGAPHPDADYASRRTRTFVVAVNCGEAGGTCFCVSMGTGPQADRGYDLALTEVLAEHAPDGEHFFLLEAGSDAGAEVADELAAPTASDADVAAARARVQHAAENMGRALDTRGLKDALQANPEHPRWEEVAGRCLSCGNCTLVCPTCFCHSEGDATELAGGGAEHFRQWDSCFTVGHSYMHGFVVRDDTRLRYRQWLLHKLALWHDQYGRSGCVGCGRCITWCPVGIDITAEAQALTGEPHAQS